MSAPRARSGPKASSRRCATSARLAVACDGERRAAADHASALARITALTLDAPALDAHLQRVYSGQTLVRDDIFDEACFAVQDLRLWWLDHAPKPATRRVEATPGRNDPCPCGSGKKYKKCHGAG